MQFQARGSESGNLIITPLDAAGGSEIGPPAIVSGTTFTEVSFDAAALGQPIGRPACENLGNASDYASVDVLAFNVIPEPSSYVLAVLAMLPLAKLSRWRTA